MAEEAVAEESRPQLLLPDSIYLSHMATAIIPDTSVWHSGVTEDGFAEKSSTAGIHQVGVIEVSVVETNSTEIGFTEIGTAEISTIKSGLVKLGTAEVSTNQESIVQTSFSQSSTAEISTTEVGFTQIHGQQPCIFQIGTAEIGVNQFGSLKEGSFQVSSTKISPIEYVEAQVSSSQVDSTQVDPTQVSSPQINSIKYSSLILPSLVRVRQLDSSKVSFSSFVPSEQLLYVHSSSPQAIYDINNSAQNLWNSLLSPTTPLDINLLITDLPTGQLAEAQITSFDPFGRPNGGTLLIDHNANGIGWYIDPTPFDHSEFTTTLTNTAFRATPSSPAAGRYDLLTTLLHEMGHLAGFIDGYSGYDSHIQTINGSQLFVGDNFSAFLTPDGSHLDPKLYPYDLMNPTLTPGVRKLPSLLDLQILNAARSVEEWESGRVGEGGNSLLQAPLDSDPLIGILNGRFDEDNATDLDKGWSTRGATTILDEEAVLNETSRFNSNFSQTFIVPEGAKYLKFTLRDTTLGNSPFDPPDAFEVALLDAHTQTSLVNTATGLTQTDAFLNIQHDGVAYYGSEVILPNTATPGSPLPLQKPMTFKVDLSGIQPGTVATLYFDLLGFGSQDGEVILDDVLLVGDQPIAPTANNDTATTDQAKPVIIDVLDNDSDADGTLDPTTLAIKANPTNGTIQINADGTMTYTPNGNFVGTDSFTYTVVDDDGLTSNAATVMVTVNNIAPTITGLEGDTNTNEGANEGDGGLRHGKLIMG